MAPLTVFDELVLHPLLGDLPMGWLHRLALQGSPVLRPTGHRLFRQDEPADSFLLLGSGAVHLDVVVPGRGAVVIDEVGAHGVVGCSWLVPPYRRALGAVVADEIRAVEFRAAEVRNLFGEDPALGLELTTRFVAILAGRLRTSSRRLAELGAEHVCPARLPAAGPTALC
ncbi:cyclic nucleotide-binding domain-containing protein [Actinoplanes sp. NPDC049599]|uniref:cyclic nucleotide-binding domain-containing protein n=1 Tax=Actinoplanes sp. NPDC049599 TaxID=3363903 RepID=UPI00379A17B9